MGNSSSTSTSDSEYSPASTVSSESCATALEKTPTIVPDTPPKPPTRDELIRNIENYCEENPNLDQLINIYGPFKYQMNTKINTLNEIQVELDKINTQYWRFLTQRMNGIQFIELCGIIYVWDNHVGISALDNYRMLKVIHRIAE
jgi:hypothetical protein